MEGFLKNDKMRITALSPIHVGSGEKIGKKEYINLVREHRVIIPDPVKMYMSLSAKNLADRYTEYVLHKNMELSVWLKQQGIPPKEYRKWQKYEMDSGDIFSGKSAANGVRPKEILSFAKDAYGMPYVPGSSLKGMIRTALLACEITHHAGKYRSTLERIKRSDPAKVKRRDRCLSRETIELETQAFHTLNREERKRSNAVNCCLSGLHIGDSKPISLSSLTLSQKIDYTPEQKERPMPILREALKPGTEIDFEISIDRTLCPYTIDDIMDALEEFQQSVYDNFYSRFGRGSNRKGIVWLGGGCGFLSKTILYPAFGEEAVKVTDAVFRSTLGKSYAVHKHNRNLSLRVAPHVCKCTRYDGKLYDMGMGRIKVL